MSIGIVHHSNYTSIELTPSTSNQVIRYGDHISLRNKMNDYPLCMLHHGRDAQQEQQHDKVASTLTIESRLKPLYSEVRFKELVQLRDYLGQLVGVLDCKNELQDTFYMVHSTRTHDNSIVTKCGESICLRTRMGQFICTQNNVIDLCEEIQDACTFLLTCEDEDEPSRDNHQSEMILSYGTSSNNNKLPTIISPFTTKMQCKKCNGEGAFSQWGPCEASDPNKKHTCPVCAGRKVTIKRTMCSACSGLGGMLFGGTCEFYDPQKISVCTVCFGRCYY
ncbi:hypothetical protein AKO1_015271 [Acrasis kona]|uniref:Uncharacterized protein n=1 Tax=Acrasis kona TaxID=1008807 RepID=A0AAW2ZF29_9EUKA